MSSNPKGFGDITDPVEQGSFSSGSPVQHTYSYFESEQLNHNNEEQGFYVGIWDTTDMVETPGPYSCDELMWLLEGEVEIKNCVTGEIERVKAGEAFVIPKGYDCQWIQKGYLKKYFVILEPLSEDKTVRENHDGVIKLPLKIDQPNRGGNEYLTFVDEEPLQKVFVAYQNKSKTFTAGLWECDGFDSELRPYPLDQFVFLQHGRLNIVDEFDNVQSFRAGEAFFIPQGTLCSWSSSQAIRTIYAVKK